MYTLSNSFYLGRELFFYEPFLLSVFSTVTILLQYRKLNETFHLDEAYPQMGQIQGNIKKS